MSMSLSKPEFRDMFPELDSTQKEKGSPGAFKFYIETYQQHI